MSEQLQVYTGAGMSRQDRIRELLQSFLSGRNSKTAQAYHGDLCDFAAFLGAEDPDTATRVLLAFDGGDANHCVLRYKQHLIERDLAAATINRRLAALRSLTKMGRMLGLITWCLEIPGLKAAPYRDVRGPGLSAIRAMMDLCRQRGDTKGVRDLAVLRLLFDLGLRRGEVVSLRLKDVELENGVLHVLGKARLQREALSLPEATQKALRAWIDRRGSEDGPLFVGLDRPHDGPSRGGLTSEGVYKVVKTLGKKLGLDVRPHGLRHSAVTAAVEAATDAGLPVPDVLQFSRHRSLSTMQVYVDHVRDSQGAIAAAVAASVM